MALTKLQTLKNYLKIDGNEEDTALLQLIEGVSSAVESFCDRVFGVAYYRQWLDGSGQDVLLLPQWPIQSLLSVSTSRTYGLEVSFTGGSAASVQVDSSKVILTSVSTAGVLTETEITFASYATLTLLAAAIAATSGWTATVYSNYGTTPSNYLRPGQSPALSPTKAYLEIVTEQAQMAMVAYGMERGIRLQSGGCFPEGRANVFVYYKAGYTLPEEGSDQAGTLPAGLTLAVHKAIKEVRELSQVATAAESVSIGDYAYKVNMDKVRSILLQNVADFAPYMRLEV